MGRAARLLGFDVDFAPVLDLAIPGAGESRPGGTLLRVPLRGRRPRRDGLPARPRPGRRRLVPQALSRPGARPRRLPRGASRRRRPRRRPDGDRRRPLHEARPRRGRRHGGPRGLSRLHGRRDARVPLTADPRDPQGADRLGRRRLLRRPRDGGPRRQEPRRARFRGGARRLRRPRRLRQPRRRRSSRPTVSRPKGSRSLPRPSRGSPR